MQRIAHRSEKYKLYCKIIYHCYFGSSRGRIVIRCTDPWRCLLGIMGFRTFTIISIYKWNNNFIRCLLNKNNKNNKRFDSKFDYMPRELFLKA